MAAIEVNTAEDGTSIDVGVGDTIQLRLLDNPAGGYRWELEPVVGESVVLDGSGHEPSSGATGSGSLIKLND